MVSLEWTQQGNTAEGHLDESQESRFAQASRRGKAVTLKEGQRLGRSCKNSHEFDARRRREDLEGPLGNRQGQGGGEEDQRLATDAAETEDTLPLAAAVDEVCDLGNPANFMRVLFSSEKKPKPIAKSSEGTSHSVDRMPPLKPLDPRVQGFHLFCLRKKSIESRSWTCRPH